jgi:hypothetical protein
MKLDILRANPPRLLLGAGVLILVAAVLSAPQSPFTTRDKAFYADANTINFVRPGLNIQVTSAEIAQDGTIRARVKLTDPRGYRWTGLASRRLATSTSALWPRPYPRARTCTRPIRREFRPVRLRASRPRRPRPTPAGPGRPSPRASIFTRSACGRQPTWTGRPPTLFTLTGTGISPSSTWEPATAIRSITLFPPVAR